MKCSHCGQELEPGAVFCGNCGVAPVTKNTTGGRSRQTQQEHTKKMRRCDVCDMLVEVGAFCKCCGNKAEPLLPFDSDSVGAEDVYAKSDYATPYREPPKSSGNTVLILAIVSAMVLVSVLVGLIVWLSNQKTNTYQKPVTATPAANEAVQTTPTPAPVPTPTPSAEPRMPSYDSSYTYKRMPNIHNSASVDDETFRMLKDEIILFDHLCADYMNGATLTPPPQLKPGSDAYKSQTGHKNTHPTLTQYYQTINVNDARFDGVNYYVWTYEVICSEENGKETTAYHHWVYRMQQEGENWYVLDYTKDPAYR